MKKSRLIAIAISSTIGILVLLFWWAGLFYELENRSLDFNFRLRGKVPVSRDVSIIAFDERSFKELGRWPWPREVHAKVIEKLTRAGAKAIAFDMLLPEPDKGNPLSDENFARASKASGKVVLASYFEYDPQGRPVNFLMPFEIFRNSANIGFANIVPELDGVCRKIPLYKTYKNEMIPSLALEALSVFLSQPPEEILRDRNIETDEFNELAINF
jgi:adenylate cyclase